MIRKIQFSEIPKVKTGNDVVRIEDHGFEWFGLFENNQLVAFVSVDHQKRTNRVKKLYTFPEHRKKGYADKLIKYLVETQENLSSHCVEASKNVFQRNGFEIIRTNYCGKEKQPVYFIKHKAKA